MLFTNLNYVALTMYFKYTVYWGGRVFSTFLGNGELKKREGGEAEFLK